MISFLFSERGCVDEDVLTAMASLGCFKDRDKLCNELLSQVHNTGLFFKSFPKQKHLKM
jgi:hypothetical protein